MKYRIGLVALLLAALLLPQVSVADTAAQRALAFAEQLQGQAATAVAVAQKRVATAEASLVESQSVEAYARRANDREAMAIAAEAVTVSRMGLAEAQQLLERAKALERQRDHTVYLLRQVSASSLSPYAVVVPIEGDVRRFNAQGEPYTRLGMEQGIHETYNYGSATRYPHVPNLDGGLNPGDRLETGPNGKARLFVAGGDGEVELGKNTSFTVEYEGVDGLLGYLERGVFHARMKFLRIKKKFEVRTPTAVTARRGTIFGVEVLPDGTLVKVYEGTVSVTPTAGGDPAEVTAGTQRRYTTGQGFLPAEPLAEADKPHPWSSDAPAR